MLVFAVASTIIYAVCYGIVVANPQFFLTEFSSSTQSSSSSTSKSTTVQIPLSQSVTSVVVHWGWLNYSHEKQALNLTILFASVFLCSYFRPFSTKPTKGDTVQKIRQRLIRHKIGNTFAIYGLFIILWSFSLIFIPLTAYDSILSLVFLFVAVTLLGISGVYLVVRTKRESGRKTKIGESLTVFGVFLAVWLTISFFLGESFFPLACLAFILLIIGYLIVKVLKRAKNILLE